VIVLGLILIALAVAAGALLFIATQPLTDTVTLEALGVQAKVVPLALLIAGAAVLVLLWLGLVMVRGSVRRKARRRRENKELERQAEREAEARRAAEARADDSRYGDRAAYREDDRRDYRADERADHRSRDGVPETAPPARFSDTRERPGDGWADDTPPGRHAATTTTATRLDETGPRTVDHDSPTVADRVMGRDEPHDAARDPRRP
jgi:hypothetical protein